MPSREELKRRVADAIDAHSEEIVGVARTILENPEPGFKEFKTSRLVVERFREMGIPSQDGLAITGVKGVLNGGDDGPTVGIFGELDSLIVPDHPHADKETGAAHACGHHCQIAMLLGAARGLSAPDVLPHLAGSVALMAVPAEEYIEIEYRNGLRKQGKLEFLGGKPEFIRLGVLDDVEMAMMCHTASDLGERKLAVSSTNNGTVAKQIQFLGRSAHAGGSPHMGINALNAAALALMAIHANRETFRDQDSIRVHPIITRGGEVVNAVPADVRIETFVRGRSVSAIAEANEKVDRALRAGAMAVGARVRIETLAGYLPLITDPGMARIYRENAVSLVGEKSVGQVEHRAGSTDMGDVSHIMPAIHPYVGGATGIGHGSDYLVQDYGLATVTAAKALAFTAVDLLADGASAAREVLRQHKPAMTKDEYLRFMRGLAKEELYDPNA
jgi:amidohydrolase